IRFAALVVKSQGDAAALSGAVRAAVREIDPAQPIHTVRTMEGLVEGSLAPQRFTARILGFFAITALFLSALGLYGVISYSVSQRTQEIGVRMALGAQRSAVLGLIVSQGLRLALMGVAVGLAASAGCARLME